MGLTRTSPLTPLPRGEGKNAREREAEQHYSISGLHVHTMQWGPARRG